MDWAEIAALPKGSRSAAAYTRYAFVWRPGASEAEEQKLSDGGVLQIFNELGGQGWRMMERTIMATTVEDYSQPGRSDFFGHKREIGVPLMERATFMRELSE